MLPSRCVRLRLVAGRQVWGEVSSAQQHVGQNRVEAIALTARLHIILYNLTANASWRRESGVVTARCDFRLVRVSG